MLSFSGMRSCTSVRPDPGHSSVIHRPRLFMRMSDVRRVLALTVAMTSYGCGRAHGYLTRGRCEISGVTVGNQLWATRRKGTSA